MISNKEWLSWKETFREEVDLAGGSEQILGNDIFSMPTRNIPSWGRPRAPNRAENPTDGPARSARPRTRRVAPARLKLHFFPPRKRFALQWHFGLESFVVEEQLRFANVIIGSVSRVAARECVNETSWPVGRRAALPSAICMTSSPSRSLQITCPPSPRECHCIMSSVKRMRRDVFKWNKRESLKK